MMKNENNLRNDRDEQSASKTQQDPQGMEGQAQGGHKFGEEGNPTPMGNANPSRFAGNTNAYFNRNEPADEDTANNNFKAAHQQGEPDYDAAKPQVPGPQERPEQQNVGGATAIADTPDAGKDYGSKSQAGEQEHIET